MKHTIALLLFAACSTTDATAPFDGTWQSYDVQVMTQCNSDPATMKQLVGNLVVTKVDDRDFTIDTASQYTLAAATGGDCTPRFHVDAGQADVVPQGTCYLTALDGTQLELDYTLYEIRLADVSGPGLAPMTPGLDVDVEASVSSANGRCQVTASGSMVTTR